MNNVGPKHCKEKASQRFTDSDVMEQKLIAHSLVIQGVWEHMNRMATW